MRKRAAAGFYDDSGDGVARNETSFGWCLLVFRRCCIKMC